MLLTLRFVRGPRPLRVCVCVCVCVRVHRASVLWRCGALSKLEHLMSACAAREGDPELCHLHLTHTHCPSQIHILRSTGFFHSSPCKSTYIPDQKTRTNSEFWLNQSISELVMDRKWWRNTWVWRSASLLLSTVLFSFSTHSDLLFSPKRERSILSCTCWLHLHLPSALWVLHSVALVLSHPSLPRHSVVSPDAPLWSYGHTHTERGSLTFSIFLDGKLLLACVCVNAVSVSVWSSPAAHCVICICINQYVYVLINMYMYMY